MSGAIEIIGFADIVDFELFDGESHREDEPLDVDLRILINTRLSLENAAEMLEAAAERLRKSAPSDLANVRRLLRKIGAGR